MEVEQNAAQEQDNEFVIDGGDHASEQIEDQASNTESAPVETEQNQETDKPTDNFQTRINKVTADKYAEKRRADELEVELNKLRNKPVEQNLKAPSLEDPEIDYDEDKMRQAQVSHQVQQELARQRATEQTKQTQAKANQAQIDFNNRIATFGKEDFEAKANAIPVLPDGVANALMQSDNGPEMIYHLGTHLDQADSLANMSPAQALMEIGRISANMSAPKQIKSSAAPDPIETLSSGSVNSKERGPSGATYE